MLNAHDDTRYRDDIEDRKPEKALDTRGRTERIGASAFDMVKVLSSNPVTCT